MKSDLTLTLGDFTFSNLEIPASISIGGEQVLAIHKLIGGARIIDAMGRDDKPLEWGGMLLGSSALSRARYLDGLRIAGKVLALKWHEMSYNVVIQSFSADFEAFYKLPYKITCVVVQDLTTPINTLAIDSVTSLVSNDMTTANAIGANVGNSALTAKLSSLQSAIKSISDFAKATQAQINSVLQPLADARAQVKVLVASVGNVVQNVTTLGGILPNNPVALSASKLLNQVTAMTQLPQLYNLDSVLGRMNSNIGTIGGGTSTTTVAGGNLYSVASKVYGDPMAWTTIAKANKLKDPQLTGVNTLIIPKTPDTNGGIFKG